MEFPPFPTGPVIAALPRPLTKLGREPFAALSADAWPAARDFETKFEAQLAQGGYRVHCRFLGLSVLARTGALLFAYGCWWYLEPATVTLNACDRAAYETLAAAGHRFDATAVRIARKMPADWTPESSMKLVGRTAYHGKLSPPAGTSLALPFVVNGGAPVAGQRWAAYVVIDIEPPRRPDRDSPLPSRSPEGKGIVAT